MEEKTLLRIALITSLFGILILLIILDKIDVSDSNIDAINETFLDRHVKIKGEIIGIAETPGLYIINIKDDTGSMGVIVFKEDKLELEKGNIVEIEGQVTEYQGKMEIIAKKITVL